jgi:Tol biopolymer transport system component
VTPDADLGRPLTSWLEGEAAMGAPDDLLPAVLDQAARTRRRPAWATSERWISMETQARLGAVPRTAVIIAIVGLLIIIAAGALAAGSGVSTLDPTGPAGNGLIAYGSEGDIWVVEPDGNDPRRVTTAPADDQAPSWSRDGTRLAYWSVDPTGSSLIAMKTDGSESMTLFTDDAGRTPHTMDWSPDGSAIAFALCPEAMCGELFVAASDGTGASSVGGSAFETYALAWSPDGKTIAFGGRYDGQPLGVYGMTPDGTDVRRIGGIEGGEGSFPGVDWSADGTSIVTHAGTDALGPDIWVVAADGGGEANLTGSAGGGFLPDLSPDDSLIAFRDGDTVFLVPTEGGDVRVIGSGEDYSWSPDAFLLVLETPGGVRMIDVRTGETVPTVADVVSVDSWQRLAP